jgi:hypothetical protein
MTTKQTALQKLDALDGWLCDRRNTPEDWPDFHCGWSETWDQVFRILGDTRHHNLDEIEEMIGWCEGVREELLLDGFRYALKNPQTGEWELDYPAVDQTERPIIPVELL